MGRPTRTHTSPSDAESFELARARYLAACESSGDGPPPDLEQFLAPFDEPERSELRSELEQISRIHERSRSRFDSGSQVRPAATRSDQTLETRKDPPQPVSDGTIDHAPPAPDRTIDHSDRPEAGDDHFSVSEATGELLSSPSEETGDVTGELIANPSDATGPRTREFDDVAEFSVGSRRSEMPNASDVTGAHEPRGDATGDYTPTKENSIAGAGKPKKRTTVPTTVAGYEVLSVLGRGAMGVVYKARQRGLKRLVALKMILSGEHASAQDIGRFQAEANAVAQLQHPGIVQIYEVGEDEGRPFFSLEFVDGPSLHKKLQGNPLPPREAAALLQKMAEAMAYAHSRGVIHRDLKPANVLLTSDGIPKIGDFGLAKRLEDDESGLTRTGAVLGTPSYMSPEQAAGLNEQVGPLADQYSLGAMLYDMLTGRPPFRGTSIMDTLQQLRIREPVPPIQLQPGVPRDLETICLKCLEKDKAKRYEDCSALAADLGRFLRGEPILARPISKIEKVWRWCLLNKRDAAFIASAALGVIVFIVGLIIFSVKLDFERAVALDARNKESEAKLEAQTQEGIAKEKKEEAERLAVVANQRKEEAEKQTLIANQKTEDARREMEAQRGTAQESLSGMIDVVGRVYDLLLGKRFSTAAAPEVQNLRKVLLNQMNGIMIQEANKINAKAKISYSDLYAYQLLADLMMKFGKSEEPRALLTTAHKVATERLEREPGNDRTRANLGVIEQRFGDLALNIEGDARTAKTRYLNSRMLHDQVRLHPVSHDYGPIEIKRNVGHDDIRLGTALIALGQSAEAYPYLQEAWNFYKEWDEFDAQDAVAKKRQRRGETRSYLQNAAMLMGVAKSNSGEFVAAESHFQTALALGQELLGTPEFADFAGYKVDMAEVELAHGDNLLRLGKTEDAIASYKSGLGHIQQWFAKYPDDTSKQPVLALLHEHLGGVNKLQGEEEEAQKNYKEAFRLRKELFELQPSRTPHMLSYILAMAHAREIPSARANSDKMGPTVAKKPEMMLQIARSYAVCARDGAKEPEKVIQQALSALKTAVGDDFKDAALIETDPDFSILRKEPAFQELISTIKKR
jgi:serine/threonine protein kinase/tetratricopeptide (TPR) repeat protein